MPQPSTWPSGAITEEDSVFTGNFQTGHDRRSTRGLK